jgi:hypothetical protein
MQRFRYWIAVAGLVSCATGAVAAENVGRVEQGSGPEVPRAAALAVNERGNWGYAVGYGIGDQDSANRDALNGCGAAGCKIAFTGRAVCVAYAQASCSDGAFWYWVAAGGRGQAYDRAKGWCEGTPEARAAGCRVAEKCQ